MYRNPLQEQSHDSVMPAATPHLHPFQNAIRLIFEERIERFWDPRRQCRTVNLEIIGIHTQHIERQVKIVYVMYCISRSWLPLQKQSIVHPLGTLLQVKKNHILVHLAQWYGLKCATIYKVIGGMHDGRQIYARWERERNVPTAAHKLHKNNTTAKKRHINGLTIIKPKLFPKTKWRVHAAIDIIKLCALCLSCLHFVTTSETSRTCLFVTLPVYWQHA